MNHTAKRAGHICLTLANIGLASIIATLYINATPEPLRHGPARAAGRPSAQQPAPTPRVTPAPVDPRIAQLTIEGQPAYNALIPTLLSVSEQTHVPADLLAMTVLTESRGQNASRYEPAFERKYITPLFTKATPNKQLSSTLETMLKTQIASGEVADQITFKRQLATSYGPAQIMYQVAVEHGYRGTAADLAAPTTNLTYAAKRIKSRASQHKYGPIKVLTDYNSGSINGTPHPGHLRRGMSYWATLHHATNATR